MLMVNTHINHLCTKSLLKSSYMTIWPGSYIGKQNSVSAITQYGSTVYIGMAMGGSAL